MLREEKSRTLFGCVLGAGLIALVGPAAAQNAGMVDDARLRAASDADDSSWITFGQDLSGQRFSSLTGINRDNVGRLAPAWIYQMGKAGITQTHPIIVDGVMYVSSSNSDVAALDAATGKQMWYYAHTMSRAVNGERNRGVAVAYGMVFLATEDERVIALDQATGEVKWDVAVKPWDPSYLVAPGDPVPAPMHYNFRWAPLAYDGKVIVSATRFELNEVDDEFLATTVAAGKDPGVEWIKNNLGRRGFVAALDAQTGEEVWRWYTTKEGDWTGGFVATAPDGQPLDRDLKQEQELAERYALGWAAGSSSPWHTPTVDTELGLIYTATGNPAPGEIDMMRPGDNLYSDGVAALDLATGELRWFFQEVPHGVYDATTQNILFDLPTASGTVAALVNCGKSGYCYVLDRATGELLYISDGVVSQENMYARGNLDGIRGAPGGGGGVGVSPISFDPNTGYLYVEGIDQPQTRKLVPVAGAEFLAQLETESVPVRERHGTVTALDLFNNGSIVWQVETPQTITGGTLATAGGLVFSGESNGLVDAYDAATGDRLWSFQTGSAVSAPPVSYSVDGRQYVVVASGAAASNSAPGGQAIIAFAVVE